MLKLYRILLHLLLLFCLIIVSAIFYFLGSNLFQSRYRLGFLDCLDIALLFCIPSYFLYLIIDKIVGSKKNILAATVISILSFGLVFFVLSFFAPYGVSRDRADIVTNIFAFALTAFSIPLLEKWILKKQ